MARPTKLGLDYFPHDTHTDADTALALVEAEFGLAAYAVYFKLLELIYSQGYAIPWGDDECLIFAKKIGAAGVSGRISEIVKGLLRRSLFDQGVMKSSRILTSRSIQQRWLEAKRKKISDIDPKVCLIEPTATDVSSPPKNAKNEGKRVFAAKTPISAAKTPVIAETIPQSKVKEIKVKKTSSPVSPCVETEKEGEKDFFSSLDPKRTLAQLAAQHGAEIAQAAVAAQIMSYLRAAFSDASGLSADEIQAMAYAVCVSYPGISLSELSLFFVRLAGGVYGQVAYGRLRPENITAKIPRFVADLNEEKDKAEQRQRQQCEAERRHEEKLREDESADRAKKTLKLCDIIAYFAKARFGGDSEKASAFVRSHPDLKHRAWRLEELQALQ